MHMLNFLDTFSMGVTPNANQLTKQILLSLSYKK